MKKLINILYFIFIIYPYFNIAGPFDTGMIVWNQPDGTEFNARYWGDEFFWWMETEDGYRIATGDGGWYYYAKLDNRGEFVLSNKKVGIDKPFEYSKGLERSAKRIEQINAERELIAQDLSLLYEENRTPKLLAAGPYWKKLGVILVDFPQSEKYGYQKKQYEDMIFSTNYWIGGERHPEGDIVFGSVNDYFTDQTNGIHPIVGKDYSSLIVNPPSANPLYPEWMITEHEKSYYANKGYLNFRDLIINEAKANYGESEINSYDCILIIYAGVDMGQNWKAFGIPGFATISERNGTLFHHIGVIAHELGHALFGLKDEYLGNRDINPHDYALMSSGNWNGPEGRGSCPAPISPGYKIDLGWVTPIIIAKDTYNQTITFGDFYKVETHLSNEYFILERYYHTGWYRHISTEEINNEDGILIWHWDNSDLYDYAEVEYADNLSDQSHNKFAYNFSIKSDFNDYTTPYARLRNGNLSDVAINNIHNGGTKGVPSSVYGIVDVIDPAPQPPSISMGGAWGENPIISWSDQGEPDIDYFILKKEYDFGSGWGTPQYVNPATSPYTDLNVIRDIFGDLVARYSVQSIDLGGNGSEYSNYVSTDGQSTWKNSASNETEGKIFEYALHKNYPNPFNPTTTISYSLPANGRVVIKIYDMLGREAAELVNGIEEAGSHSIVFNANNLVSGAYIVNMIVNSAGGDVFKQSRKILLMK